MTTNPEVADMPWILVCGDDPRDVLARFAKDVDDLEIDPLEDGSWIFRDRPDARTRANARQRRYRAKRRRAGDAGDAGDAREGDAGDAGKCPNRPEMLGNAERPTDEGGRSVAQLPGDYASDASRGDARDGDAGDALYGMRVTYTDDEKARHYAAVAEGRAVLLNRRP